MSSAQKFAISQYTLLNVANPNLDGTGAINTVIQSTGDGTIVNTLIIKSAGSTSLGMVRLYLFDGVKNHLIREIMIAAVKQTPAVSSFFTRIEIDLLLEKAYELRASTEFADEINVLAFGEYWDVCPCSR
jgi:hypothetical protein